MTAYRVGQRVRIEVEGTLKEDGRGNVLRVIWDNGGGATFSVNGETAHWVGAATVTVLSEPRPDEPRGLGAVVEASWSHQGGVSPQSAEKWVRLPAPDGGRWWNDGRYAAHWQDLIDPVVLSEGWTP